jgi:hypothetical protein
LSDEREDRATALQGFLEEQLPDYATWRKSRHEKFTEIENLAEIRHPLIDIEPLMNDWIARSQAVRENDATERRKKDFVSRHKRNWENRHPSPLTFEKRRELEAEFTRTYVWPIARS